MKLTVFAFILAASFSSQAIANTSDWVCAPDTDEGSELEVSFSVTDAREVTELHFFNDDTWRRLDCTQIANPARQGGVEQMCSYQDESIYVTAQIAPIGRSLLKGVSVLELDRFTLESLTTEFRCKSN